MTATEPPYERGPRVPSLGHGGQPPAGDHQGHHQYGQPVGAALHARPRPARAATPGGRGVAPDTVSRAVYYGIAAPATMLVATALLLAVNAGTVAGFIGPGVALAIGVGLSVPFRRGQNWARVTLTVLAGLSMLVELVTVVVGIAYVFTYPAVAAGLIMLIGGVIGLIVLVAAVVQAWKAENSAWFARS